MPEDKDLPDDPDIAEWSDYCERAESEEFTSHLLPHLERLNRHRALFLAGFSNREGDRAFVDAIARYLDGCTDDFVKRHQFADLFDLDPNIQARTLPLPRVIDHQFLFNINRGFLILTGKKEAPGVYRNICDQLPDFAFPPDNIPPCGSIPELTFAKGSFPEANQIPLRRFDQRKLISSYRARTLVAMDLLAQDEIRGTGLNETDFMNHYTAVFLYKLLELYRYLEASGDIEAKLQKDKRAKPVSDDTMKELESWESYVWLPEDVEAAQKYKRFLESALTDREFMPLPKVAHEVAIRRIREKAGENLEAISRVTGKMIGPSLILNRRIADGLESMYRGAHKGAAYYVLKFLAENPSPIKYLETLLGFNEAVSPFTNSDLDPRLNLISSNSTS